MDELIFKNHLKKYLNDQEINNLITSFDNNETKGLFLNTNFSNLNIVKEAYPFLKEHKIVPNAFYYSKENELGKSQLFNMGYFYIQESSSTLVPYLLNIEDDDFVLDMCSAPGGKAIFAALKNKNGVLISNDISKQRCNATIENIERLGLDNIIVTSNDFCEDKYSSKFLDTFDKIILDAPCSGSGMFRKDNKMKDDWTINKVISLSEIQKTLIVNAYKMLKPGGRMSYSTCSYSYEEDEEVVKHLLNNSDAKLVNIQDNECFFRSESLKETIHLFPNKFHGEGQYVAIIEKPGIKNKTQYKPNLKCNLPEELKGKLQDRSNIEINNVIYSLNKNVDYKNLYILRYGVKIASKENKIYKLEHHFAKAINSLPQIDLNNEQKDLYLKGYELNHNFGINGYAIATYNKNPLGLVKINKEKVKNHYPKGLRR